MNEMYNAQKGELQVEHERIKTECQSPVASLRTQVYH